MITKLSGYPLKGLANELSLNLKLGDFSGFKGQQLMQSTTCWLIAAIAPFALRLIRQMLYGAQQVLQ